MKKRTSATESRERQLLALICRGLDDKKAGDLKVIDVGGLSSITDYIVIATGLAEPHLRALRIEVEKVLDAEKVKIGGMDKNQHSGWLVVDAYQIMVHLFTATARAHYALEQLWRDGREISLPVLFGQEEEPVLQARPAAKKKTAAKKAPAKKTPAKKGKPAAKAAVKVAVKAKAPAKKPAAPKAKTAAKAPARKPAAKKKA